MSLLSSAALPGMPQNVTANMIASPSEDCVILLQWMPPSVAESSVNHYVIDSSSGCFITRHTSVETALLIHHCNDTTYIRIHAVDYCDRDGPSTNDVLGLLLVNTTLPPVTVSRNATGSTQSSGEMYKTYYYYYDALINESPYFQSVERLGVAWERGL